MDPPRRASGTLDEDQSDLGEDLDKGYCRQLLHEDPATLVPAMYLFDPSHGSEAQAEARELLQRCHDDGTTRARYVASVIEGVLRRSARR